jgi:Zn-dependent oligopeptidase
MSLERSTVYHVTKGRRRSARIEAEIARILGKNDWNEVVLEARSEVQKKPVAVILREMKQKQKAREKEFFAGLSGAAEKARRGA